MVHGPSEATVGSTVTIQCNILEGYPLPSVYIITPQGSIDQSTITFNVTQEHAGNYSCVANNSLATVTSNLSLAVYGMKLMLKNIVLLVTVVAMLKFCSTYIVVLGYLVFESDTRYILSRVGTWYYVYTCAVIVLIKY